MYRYKNRYQDGDWRKKVDYKEKSGQYVPSRNYDDNSRMEALLANLVKESESQESYL